MFLARIIFVISIEIIDFVFYPVGIHVAIFLEIDSISCYAITLYIRSPY